MPKKLSLLVMFFVLSLILYKYRGKIYEFKVSLAQCTFKFIGEHTADVKPIFSKEIIPFDCPPNPIEVRFWGKNQNLLATKDGLFLIYDQNWKLKDTLLDISPIVYQSYQEGMYGFDFRPYDSLIVVNYISNLKNLKTNQFKNNISLFYLSEGKFKEKNILSLLGKSHYGGGLQFYGNDLYICTGDGQMNDPKNRAQNLNSLRGKVLKYAISEKYKVSPSKDNPFQQKNQREVYAYGLRNPFRLFKNKNVLLVADVGHDRIEEINLVKKGGNYGWSIKEGSQFYKHSIKPKAVLEESIYAYNHGVDGFSVTGGLVYEGNKFPNLKGKYIYGDFISGRIWALDLPPNKPKNELLLINAGSMTSFGQTHEGDIIWTDMNQNNLCKLTIRR